MDIHHKFTQMHACVVFLVGLLLAIPVTQYINLSVYQAILVLIAFCAALIGMGVVWYVRKDTRTCFQASICLLVGLIAGFVRTSSCLQNNSIPTDDPCTVIGVVKDITRIEKNKFCYAITLDVLKYRSTSGGAWSPGSFRCLVYTKTEPSDRVGDHIKIPYLRCSSLQKKPLQLYLKKEHVDASAFCSRYTSYTLHRPQFSLTRWLDQTRKRILGATAQSLDGTTGILFSSLFLGNKATLKSTENTIGTQFKRWGIVHQLARSGLHLVLFVAIWLRLLRYLPLSFFTKQVILLLLTILYYVLSWPSIPFLRASCVFLLHKLCLFLKLSAHTLHLLVLTSIFLLLHNPLQLFFLDFQLSFLFTFALIRISQNLYH